MADWWIWLVITAVVAFLLDRFMFGKKKKKGEDDESSHQDAIDGEKEKKMSKRLFAGADAAIRVKRNEDGSISAVGDDGSGGDDDDDDDEKKKKSSGSGGGGGASASESQQEVAEPDLDVEIETAKLLHGHTKVTLASVRDDFHKRLRMFWDRDEAEFCRAWKRLDEEQRLGMFSMLVLNVAKGAKVSGYSIDEDKYPVLVPEFAPERVKRMAAKPHLIGDLIAKVATTTPDSDVQFLRSRADEIEGLVMRTGASLGHEVCYRPTDEDNGEKALSVFVTVRRLLLCEVLVIIMDLTLGRTFDGKPSGRAPLADAAKHKHHHKQHNS